MKKLCLTLAASICLCLALVLRADAQQMTVDSLDGPVTANEVASFRNFIQTISPVTWAGTGDMENEYAQGHSGEDVKAMGLMYELTHDQVILDRMIYFCDTLLAQRNDLLGAPSGQQTYNTGTIAPAWPGSLTTTPIYSTSASGDCVGHLAYCARLILQTPALWNQTCANGLSYLACAQNYVTQADYTYDQYFFPSMLDLSSQNILKYSASSPYQPGNQLPWNQVMMMVYPLENLAVAHEILADDATRVARYDAIVQTNISRFFTDPTVMSTYTDPTGQPAYDWSYTPTANAGEDSNHGALDVGGFWRAYASGRYGVTTAQMIPFANAFCDVMTRTIGADYAGTVDGNDGTGHAGATAYVRSGYLYLAQFRPDQYYNMVFGAELGAGVSTGSTDSFSRTLWEKNARYLANQAFTLSVPTTSLPVVAGNSASLVATISPQNGYAGAVDLTVTGLPTGVSATISPASLTSGGATITFVTAGSTIPDNYPIIVTGISGHLVQVAPFTLAVSSLSQVTQPVFAPAGGTYTTIQSVAIASPTAGASIRYTVDGSTPTASTGTLYAGPVTVAANATVKAIAYQSGLTNSLVSTAIYTINLPTAAAPDFAPAAGQFAGTQAVSVTSTSPGATIRYTLDGSVPSATTGLVYSGPVAVAYTDTLKAVALATGLAASPVSAGDYVIGPNVPAKVSSATTGLSDSTNATGYVPANTVDGNLGTRWAASGDGVWIQYDLGAVETINSLNIAWYLGTTRTYTFDLLVSMDGLTWTTVINRLQTSGLSAALENYDFAPIVGQFVRIVGHLSSVDAYTNITELEIWGSPTGAPAVVAPPSFTPAAGTYPSAEIVTIASTTSGATIRYTTDGSAPTETTGTLYAAPVSVVNTATLKAIAYASGYADSAVASSAYTISNGALPSGWTDVDVGAVPLAGTGTFSSGTYTVKGSGADIWTTADQFNYAYTAASGDATITARIATLVNTNVSAKAGVMFRETTAAGSRYVIMALLPTHGVALQDRVTTGASAVQASATSGPLAPYWVRLVRAGNVFTGYVSPDGATWTSQGSVTIAMAANATAGLAVCSHTTTSLTTSTIDHVTLALSPAAAPAFSPASGSFTSPQSIAMTSATAGAILYYTTDGTTPSAGGAPYAGPVAVGYGTTTLKALAVSPGNAPSAVTSGTYQVSDATPPVLSLPANQTLEGNAAGGAVVTFAATANDNLDGSVLVSFSPASGSLFPVGTTLVTATAQDHSGNQASGTFTVTVTDTTAPALALPADLVVEATGPAGAAASFTGTATDVVSGDVPVVFSPASGSSFALGVTHVSASAADAAGNQASGAFNVTVVDTTAPALSLPRPITVQAASVLGAPVSFTVSAADLVSGSVPVTVSMASGSVFPVGSTTVTATASDGAGNAVTGSFVVTVVAPPTAVVSHAPSINGALVGSIEQNLPESVTLNSSASISGELLVPGTPSVTRNGSPTYGGFAAAGGSATPTNFSVTLNGGAALGRLVGHVDAAGLPTVATPAAPSGTRSVSLNHATDAVGAWPTVLNLTLNGDVGSIAVPAGTYGNLTANSGSQLVLGVAGSTVPTVYNLQGLTLNGSSALSIVGPVVITVNGSVSVNGAMGSAANPGWLVLQVAAGGVTVNSSGSLAGFVIAPAGTVTLNAAMTGGVKADRLVINSAGSLHLVSL